MPPFGPYEDNHIHAPPYPSAGLPYSPNYPPPPPPPPPPPAPPYRGNAGFPPNTPGNYDAAYGGYPTGLSHAVSGTEKKKSGGILGSVKKSLRKNKGQDDYLRQIDSFHHNRQGLPPAVPTSHPPAVPESSEKKKNVVPLQFEKGMEAVYKASVDQIRRAAEYHENEAQDLLNSLMPAGGKKLKKKEMEEITAKAFEHANEGKRLLRKAEMMEIEEAEPDISQGGFFACGGGDRDIDYGDSADRQIPRNDNTWRVRRDEQREDYVPDRNLETKAKPSGDCAIGLCLAGGDNSTAPRPSDAPPTSLPPPLQRRPSYVAEVQNTPPPPLQRRPSYVAEHLDEYRDHPPLIGSFDGTMRSGRSGQYGRPSSPDLSLARRSVVIDEVRDPPDDRSEYDDAEDATGTQKSGRGRKQKRMMGFIRSRSKSREHKGSKDINLALSKSKSMKSILRSPSRDPQAALALSRSLSGDAGIASQSENAGVPLALSRSRSKETSLGGVEMSLSKQQVIALALSRSMSKDEMEELSPTNDPEIAYDIHKAEEEITAMLEDKHYVVSDFLEADDDTTATPTPVTVAPSNLKIISKVSMEAREGKPKVEQKPPKDEIILNLPSVARNQEINERRRRHSFSSGMGPTNVSLAKPVAPKRRHPFKKGVISRLTKSKSRKGRSTDDGPEVNEFVVYCLSQDKAKKPKGGSIVTAPPGATKDKASDEPMNKRDILYRVTHEPSALGKPPISNSSEGRALKLGASFDEKNAALEASDSFQMLVNTKKIERLDRLDIEAKIEACGSKHPAPGLRRVPSDPPILSPSNSEEDEDANFVEPKYAQIEAGSVLMNDKMLMNKEEIAEAINRAPSRPTSPVQRHWSNKGLTHDDHDLPRIKSSDSFAGFVERKRIDALKEKGFDANIEDFHYAPSPFEDDETYGTPASFEDGEDVGQSPEYAPNDHDDYAEEDLAKSFSMKKRVGSFPSKMKRRLSLKRGGKKRDDEIPPTAPGLERIRSNSTASGLERIRSNSISSSNVASSRGLTSRADSSKGVHSSRSRQSSNRSDQACANMIPSDSTTENQANVNNNASAQQNFANFNVDPMPASRHVPTNTFQAQRPMQSKTDMLLEKMSNDSSNVRQTHSFTPGTTPLAPKLSPYPALVDSRASLQRSSSRANKRNVDNLLRRMRSDDSFDIGSDSEYDSADNSMREPYLSGAAQNYPQNPHPREVPEAVERSNAEQQKANKGWFDWSG